ncbi:MAG: YncE family protein [Capsulimonadaceae bacterium]
MKFIAIAALGAALVYPAAQAAAAPTASAYHVIKSFTPGGDGRWDYLNIDSGAHRLYVSRSSYVQVIDLDTDKVVGTIPNTAGVHGIALAPEFNRGYTSNGEDDSVTIFDLTTLDVVDTVQVGDGPDCIIYDPSSKRVFTFNGRAGTSTAIDAQSGKVVGTVTLDGRPEYAVSDGKGSVYVNIEDKSEIQQIDAHALTAGKPWPLAPGESPSGLSMDRHSRRLFSTCHNNHFVVMNADTGAVIAAPPIGDGPDAAAFDPGPAYAFSSNGRDATLTIVAEKDANTFSVAANVPTESGARTMALDPRTHRIYLVTAKFTPPPAGATGWQRRGSMIPGTFKVIVVGP